MKKSIIPVVARKVHESLLKSERKDIELSVKGDKYFIAEGYEEGMEEIVLPKEFSGYGASTIGFYYPNKEIPNVEEIERFIYNYFHKIV